MLSVIVPVYNVEAYVERCVRSIMEQSLDDMEVIFVNDCTPDGSMEVINRVMRDYPWRIPNVKVINQPRNMGVAAARTAAMKAMRGDYMAHCDADDWLDHNAYAIMYAAAKAVDADMVTCRYVTEPRGSGAEGACFSGDAIDCLRKGLYTYGLWDKIIRASIIRDNGIYPFEGINYNEDLNVIVRALCYSKRVVGIDIPFYHHLVGREGSICNDNYRHHVLEESVPSMRLLDDWLDDFGRSSGRKEINRKLTRKLKFWMKSGFYTGGSYAEWRALWPECRGVIMQMSSLSLKEKLLMLYHTF